MTAIKITRNQMIAMEPCDLDDRLKLFGPRRKSLTAKQALAAGASISDLLWVAGHLGLKDQSVRFALACAQRVAHLDKTGSAQACIDATTAYWGDKTEPKRKTMLEARRAADAATYATYATYAAASYATYAAAAASASAVASAASASAAASSAAASSAAASAAYAADARQKEVEAQQALFLKIFG